MTQIPLQFYFTLRELTIDCDGEIQDLSTGVIGPISGLNNSLQQKEVLLSKFIVILHGEFIYI